MNHVKITSFEKRENLSLDHRNKGIAGQNKLALTWFNKSPEGEKKNKKSTSCQGKHKTRFQQKHSGLFSVWFFCLVGFVWLFVFKSETQAKLFGTLGLNRQKLFWIFRQFTGELQ